MPGTVCEFALVYFSLYYLPISKRATAGRVATHPVKGQMHLVEWRDEKKRPEFHIVCF